MKKKIDLTSWKRKAHFDFFNQFADPSFEATAKVDVTKAYLGAKANNESFFLRYLHASMRAVNTIDEFKTRIEEDGLFQYDIIHAGPTIAREDGTFGFSHLPFFEDFDEFAANAKPIIEEVKAARDLNPSSFRANVIHYSSVPWVDFTGIKHPVFSTETKESVPKITFGKVTEKNGKYSMPVSVNANHALLDGRHIGQFLDAFQENLDQ